MRPYEIAASAEDAANEQDSDEERADTRTQSDHRGEQAHPDLAMVHQPFAWSTIRAVNGGAPGTATRNVSPHLPTMTSACLLSMAARR